MSRNFFKDLSNSLRGEPEVRTTYESKMILEMAPPVKASTRTGSVWEVLESPRRLRRTYEFQDLGMLRSFIDELLVYQGKKQHSGEITIDHLAVTIEVYTKDLNCVTELDYEYAKNADLVYQDVGYY